MKEVANIRDRFAAQALNGMISSSPMCDRTEVDKAKWASVAYEFADAMLTARKTLPPRRSNVNRSAKP